jgi:hypothetical protein
VGVLDPGNELLEELAGLRLGHLPTRDDVVEQLPTGVFKHNDDVRRCGYDFVSSRMSKLGPVIQPIRMVQHSQLNDMRMS